MNVEAITYSEATAKAVHVERDQSAVDRALMDLEKAQAELSHVLLQLGSRLVPVIRDDDGRGARAVPGADPSTDSPLLRAIRCAVERTQSSTGYVLDLTEGLDI